MPIRTNDSIELVKQALIALKYIYKKGYKYQKVGIIFSALSDVGIYKKNLFSLINSEEKRKKLMKAIDYTNNKYGRNALSIAHAGLKKNGTLKDNTIPKLIPLSFDFLPIVKNSLKSLNTINIFQWNYLISSIFSREEVLIIRNKNKSIASTGKKVIRPVLDWLEIKNNKNQK